MRIRDRVVNWGYRKAYRLAFPLARKWWSIYGNDGILVAVWIDDRVLAVRHSYKLGLKLPGGGIARGENERMTVVRELHEEIGLTIALEDVIPVLTTFCRYGLVHLFEVRLNDMPNLHIDRREIIHAEFISPASIDEDNAEIIRYLLYGRDMQ
jgi:8-oxo-dGTP pyrophosphatase MutT (NUDIX family)